MKMPSVTIRTARVNDYSACLRLFTSLYHGDIGVNFRHIFEHYVTKEEGVILLAEQPHNLVGILVGSFHFDIDWEGKTARIDAIIVDEAHRTKRIGKKLMQHFIVRAKERNCKAVKSRVNLNNVIAQEFHESLGFTRANTYEYILDFQEQIR